MKNIFVIIHHHECGSTPYLIESPHESEQNLLDDMPHVLDQLRETFLLDYEPDNKGEYLTVYELGTNKPTAITRSI